MAQLHKVVGYGLLNLQVKAGTIVDDRINPKGYINNPEAYSLAEFLHIVPPPSLSNCIYYGCIDTQGVLCIVPPDHQFWHRTNDTLDLAEETGQHKNKAIVLKRGIIPFKNYIDRHTRKSLSSILVDELLTLEETNVHAHYEQMKRDEAMSDLASELGYNSVGDALDSITPIIPPILKPLCAFLKIFNDLEDVDCLRPLLYVYWT